MLLCEKNIKLRWNGLTYCIIILSKTLSLLKFIEKYIKCERTQCTKKRYHTGNEKHYSLENINNIKRFFQSPVKK